MDHFTKIEFLKFGDLEYVKMIVILLSREYLLSVCVFLEIFVWRPLSWCLVFVIGSGAGAFRSPHRVDE